MYVRVRLLRRESSARGWGGWVPVGLGVKRAGRKTCKRQAASSATPDSCYAGGGRASANQNVWHSCCFLSMMRTPGIVPWMSFRHCEQPSLPSRVSPFFHAFPGLRTAMACRAPHHTPNSHQPISVVQQPRHWRMISLFWPELEIGSTIPYYSVGLCILGLLLLLDSDSVGAFFHIISQGYFCNKCALIMLDISH